MMLIKWWSLLIMDIYRLSAPVQFHITQVILSGFIAAICRMAAFNSLFALVGVYRSSRPNMKVNLNSFLRFDTRLIVLNA